MNHLAEQKGSVVPADASYEDIEFLVDSWVYIGYHDAGRVSSHSARAFSNAATGNIIISPATGEKRVFISGNPYDRIYEWMSN